MLTEWKSSEAQKDMNDDTEMQMNEKGDFNSYARSRGLEIVSTLGRGKTSFLPIAGKPRLNPLARLP